MKRTDTEIKALIREEIKNKKAYLRDYFSKRLKKPKYRKYKSKWAQAKRARSIRFKTEGYFDPKTNTTDIKVILIGKTK